MTEDASLEAIAPDEQIVLVGDQSIRIRPLTIGQLPAFSRAIAPAVPVLQGLFAKVRAEMRAADERGGDEPETDERGGDEPETEDGPLTFNAADIMGALESSEALVEAVRIGAGLTDRKFYEAQGLDVLVRLAGAVFQVNADFFGRALAPAAVEVVGRALLPTGTPSSPDLSDTGTRAPTS